MRHFTRPRSGAPRRPLHGFTLVELLVVIAIIGVLIALLLPAIQAAREAARRAQCQSQLHNLALAVLNYESAKKAMPQSNDGQTGRTGSVTVTSALNDAGGNNSQLSWIVRVLPYMEQQQLFTQFDLKKAFNTWRSENVANVPTPEAAQPAAILCPSDQAQGRQYKSSPFVTGNRSFGKANYAVYVSAEHIECQTLAAGSMINSPQDLRRFEDGQSNTLMLAEVRTRDEATDPRGAWALAWPGATMLGADVHATTSQTRICNQSNPPSYVPNPIWKDLALTPNLQPVSASTPRDDIRECVDSAGADLEGMPCWTRGDTTVAPRSLHPGSVNGANADGSVRVVNDDIDAVILGSLVCINDGLTIAAE